MSPHQILAKLKTEGVILKVARGRLLGPKSMTKAQRELVNSNRSGLIAVLTNQCPKCDQPLRLTETSRYFELECPSSGVHYWEVVNKRPGQPMGLFGPLEASDTQDETRA